MKTTLQKEAEVNLTSFGLHVIVEISGLELYVGYNVDDIERACWSLRWPIAAGWNVHHCGSYHPSYQDLRQEALPVVRAIKTLIATHGETKGSCADTGPNQRSSNQQSPVVYHSLHLLLEFTRTYS
jgi:hypothetical protein